MGATERRPGGHVAAGEDVTFPNGKLAETRSESVSARDRIRLHVRLGLD
jgi:hypothetical protein